MTFAFCIFKYFPYGGVARNLVRMLDECVRRGHRVRVYTLLWQAPPIDAVEVVIVPVQALTNHARYRRFAQWTAQHLLEHPVDLVIGMNKMTGLDVYYAGDSCYEDKVRTQRDWAYRLLPRYRQFAASERAVFDRHSSTEILTISAVQTPLFRKYYGTQWERLHALPPGVDRSRRAPPDAATIRAQLREQYELNDEDRLVLFIGSGFIKKGLDRAIEGFAALPDDLRNRSRLFVIGEDNSRPFEARIERRGLSDRITFLRGRDDVARFLFGADAFVLPAYDENTGTVIVEAIIAGVPVLATENCGFAHYVEDADAGLLVRIPYSQQSFNDKFVELLTSPARSRWARNGLAFGGREEIYRRADVAVGYFERFASGGYKRPAARPELAFCLFKYFPYGGMQRTFLRIAEQCLKLGYRVRVYTLAWEGRLPDEIDVVVVPVHGVTNHRRYARFAQWVHEALALQPVSCVVGFNKMPGLDVYYAADPCYLEKSFLERHGDTRPRGGLYRNSPRYRYFAGAERVLFERGRSTRILLIAVNQQREFERHYQTEPERYTLLPPGITRDRMAPDNAAEVRAGLRAELHLQEHELLLLLIGSGFITKGLDRCLLALAQLPPDLRERTRLIAIGQDNPRSFLRMAQRLQVAERFNVLAGRDDVPRFLQGADLLLHPAYSETAGNVLLEAIVAGLPSIVTDVCGNAPYVERARAGVVMPTPFRQDLFNERVAALLEDSQRRKGLRANGIAFGRSNDLYSLPECAARLIAGVADAKLHRPAALNTTIADDRRVVSAG